jgi:hypothetical protein
MARTAEKPGKDETAAAKKKGRIRYRPQVDGS